VPYSAKKKNFWFGIAMIVIAMLTLMMFGFEIYDGKLEGSRNGGVTQAGSPVIYYISTGSELIIGLALLAGGIYLLRKKD
jgi:amino acid permease